MHQCNCKTASEHERLKYIVPEMSFWFFAGSVTNTYSFFHKFEELLNNKNDDKLFEILPSSSYFVGV